MREQTGEFELDDDPDRVDLERVWAFLSEHAYWSRWRSRHHVEAQLRNAWRVVAAYTSLDGQMVGFARAISDGVAFAYLADLYVLHDVRGRRLGSELVRFMIDAGPGADFRWALHTADAHRLYERFGFAVPDSTYMERPSTRPAVDDGDRNQSGHGESD